MDYASVARRIEDHFSFKQDLEKLLLEMEQLSLSCGTDTPEGNGIRTQLQSDRFMLACALQERFAEIRENPAHTYEEFASVIVQAGDGIITFNYDVSLERELRRAGKWQVGDGYGFEVPRLPNKSPVKILKLHGSSNWLASLYINMAGYGQTAPGYVFGPRPVISHRDVVYLGYTNERDISFQDGRSGYCPLLVLPAASKEFFLGFTGKRELSTFFDELWQQAERFLAKSDKVVICGYGMPNADKRACTLLLRAIGENSQITILSRGASEEVAQRFRNSAHANVTVLGETSFEEWVSLATKLP
jgi:hypothetical protein